MTDLNYTIEDPNEDALDSFKAFPDQRYNKLVTLTVDQKEIYLYLIDVEDGDYAVEDEDGEDLGIINLDGNGLESFLEGVQETAIQQYIDDYIG